MILVIDSSVYLSALLAKDIFHAASLEFLKKIRQQKIDCILPSLVPLEVTNTLHRRGLTVEKAEDVFESFYETSGLRIVPVDHALSQALVKELPRFDLRTSDWIIAGTCFHFKAKLITWDGMLLERTRGLLGTQTPQEFFVDQNGNR